MWTWAVVDVASGREWPSRGGGYGGGIDSDGRCAGGGGWQFDVVPSAGDVVQLHGSVDGAIVFEAEAVLRPAPVERLSVDLVEASSRPVNGSGLLIQALEEHGWRRGRAVADEVVAVEVDTIPFDGRELETIATERWGRVRRLTIRIGGGPLEDVPMWWVLDIDGVCCPAMTDGLQSATGGDLGHLVLIR